MDSRHTRTGSSGFLDTLYSYLFTDETEEPITRDESITVSDDDGILVSRTAVVRRQRVYVLIDVLGT
jgi:hypothetical protein